RGGGGEGGGGDRVRGGASVGAACPTKRVPLPTNGAILGLALRTTDGENDRPLKRVAQKEWTPAPLNRGALNDLTPAPLKWPPPPERPPEAAPAPPPAAAPHR